MSVNASLLSSVLEKFKRSGGESTRRPCVGEENGPGDDMLAGKFLRIGRRRMENDAALETHG
jgi:hypothetical protein